ncbi:hypothetical protein CHU98_g779 [Xylaria longipes]|nr:hypothetical protein CHU98_g779 [Xylaria longipes]
MSQLPEGTLGDAVGVLIFTFICGITNILLLWLFWINNERLWDDLAWAQLRYIKANYKNADVIFNNGNFGFMRVLAIIRLFCYIVESSYLLAYNYDRLAPDTSSAKQLYRVHDRSELAIIVLLSIVIRQYVMSKLAWRRVQTTSEPGSFWSRLRNSSSSNSSKEQSTITPSITPAPPRRIRAIPNHCSAFIVANIVTHLPQADDVARDARADVPDLGPERARSNIIGYIFGVTPGLAIWVVFGLTRDFRRIMYETFIPRRWRRRGPTPPPPLEASWDAALGRQQTQLSGVVVDTGLQLDDMNVGAKRRPLPDKMDAPLVATTSTPRLAPSDRSISRDEQISIG